MPASDRPSTLTIRTAAGAISPFSDVEGTLPILTAVVMSENG